MHGLSRRTFLKLAGVGAGALGASAALGVDPARAAALAGTQAASRRTGPPVSLLLNGSPGTVGIFAFPTAVDTVVLDNELVRFTFTRDDAPGIVTGWPDVSITASSVVVGGVELAHNLNGISPRDPDRQHSFYIDASGGKSRLVCSEIRVLRLGSDLTEVVFADTTSSPLRHEHHLIMRQGTRGLYGYNVLTNAGDTPTGINEIRMNTRWDRGILDHAYNWERGSGQQPTYAYLVEQPQVQDETWIVSGQNDPNLPWPASNGGNLPAGTVYTKYDWTLYHHENPMFGHFGNGFGAWFTALGGVTDETLCSFYGVGPSHQDLAIHQDALILNYFGANHYGLPGYTLQPGYRRLYGPWLTFLTVGDPTDPRAMIAHAAALARSEIAENRAGATWVADPLYPAPGERATVKGRLEIADGRPAGAFWVVLSTQDVTDVYTIHEPTYFVKTAEDGTFALPGIPPGWAPGTKTPGPYTLYIFAGQGSVTDQYKQEGIMVAGGVLDLGTIRWAPTNHTTFLWQIGQADRTGGEFALAAYPPDFSNPRAYEKPSHIPGNLTFVVGSNWEPQDWYYAQTQAGTWTVQFNLDRAYTGTVYLTVSSSMQQSHPPAVALNGSPPTSGALPANNDSTIARQADRSGYPRMATLAFDASVLQVGQNTLTLTRGSGVAAGNGLGWDTFLFEVDELQAPPPASLTGRLAGVSGTPTARTLTIEVDNHGAGPANDLRIEGLTLSSTSGPAASPVFVGRDPNRAPVPVIASLAPGASAAVDLTLNLPDAARFVLSISFSANGGRSRGTIVVSGSDLS